MDRYDDAAYVTKVLAEAKRTHRVVYDSLAPNDETKTQYIVPWEITVDNSHIFEEEQGLEGTLAPPDREAVNGLFDGPSAILGGSVASVAGHLGLSSSADLEGLGLSPAMPNPAAEQDDGQGKNKRRRLNQQTPKKQGGDAQGYGDPPATLKPETVLTQAQKTTKVAIKQATEARSTSKQLSSLGVSENLATWLEGHSVKMETLFAELTSLASEDPFNEVRASQKLSEFKSLSELYKEKSELAKASLNVTQRRLKKRLEA